MMESHAILEEMDDRMTAVTAQAGTGLIGTENVPVTNAVAKAAVKSGFQIIEGEKKDTITADASLPGQSVTVTVKPLLYRAIKRLMDIVCSVAALIVLSPVFLITAAAIKLEDRGPVFYVQKRNGLNGKVFRMYKFRSMCRNAEEIHKQLLSRNELDGPAFKLKDDPRVTRVGRFIRRASIDELPQLVNIIKGEMSIVGPRPLPTYETEQCNDYQKQRMLVKPGLTCYWQICGRSKVPFDEWIEMDLKYIREAGVWVDFKMIVKTVVTVITGKGAY